MLSLEIPCVTKKTITIFAVECINDYYEIISEWRYSRVMVEAGAGLHQTGDAEEVRVVVFISE